MNYYTYNENFEYQGVTETEPNTRLDENNEIIDDGILFTLVEYTDAFFKPKFDVDNQIWIEIATSDEIRKSQVPEEISPRQFKLALALNGIKPIDIENFINSLEEPTKTLAMINWLDATTFKRTNEMINSFAPMIGLTEEQLDNLFILGNTFD